MKKKIIHLVAFFLIISNNVAYTSELVGWVEKVRLYPGNVVVNAKIDTGARTSSLHVSSVKLVERNREEWIHFKVTGLKGNVVLFKRKIKRIATIKRHFGEPHRRLVILMGICLGNTYREAEVNLINRSGFNYPMLIGRQYMKNHFTVDPSQKFSVKPKCKGVPKE
jgi:hypothetical protein